jgi:ElaB/YqjD/DUF883 family membrane-anchored ribosome-binding protein
MAGETEADIKALQAEIKRLRTDFASLTETLRDIVQHGTGEAAAKAQEAGERVWLKTKGSMHSLGQEIEDKPVTSAITAFGIGVILGTLFSSRRS